MELEDMSQLNILPTDTERRAWKLIFTQWSKNISCFVLQELIFMSISTMDIQLTGYSKENLKMHMNERPRWWTVGTMHGHVFKSDD
jgi:hypothetical protein